MTEHNHDHNDACGCGCGGHEHHHHADAADCDCDGHEHHDHACGCGCGCGHQHDHEHAHSHDHQRALTHDEAVARGVFAKTVDGAVVGSVSFDVVTQEEEETIQHRVAYALAQVSAAIESQGGIVGHAKASLERKTISKVSVIDGRTTIDTNDVATYAMDVAIISFMVEEEFLASKMKEAFGAFDV